MAEGGKSKKNTKGNKEARASKGRKEEEKEKILATMGKATKGNKKNKRRTGKRKKKVTKKKKAAEEEEEEKQTKAMTKTKAARCRSARHCHVAACPCGPQRAGCRAWNHGHCWHVLG